MRAPNSLLRPPLAAMLSVGMLAFAAPAFAASPDPSPNGGYSPDPYPAQTVPPRAPAPAGPTHVVVVPRTTTVVVHAAAKPKPKAKVKVKVKAASHVRRPTTAPPERMDDHRAAGFFALTAPSLVSKPLVSVPLACALAMFVLLNALFLVGASRAVQQR